MNDRGLLIIYTGNGKGKTTAAVGLGMRAIGHGHKVKMLQFIKHPERPYGEAIALGASAPGFEVKQVGLGCSRLKGEYLAEDLEAAARGLEEARSALSGEYELVILDELNVALAQGLLKTNDVIDALTKRNAQTTVVITGRYAPAELLSLADTVSVIDNARHHMSQGITMKKGIDY